MKDYYYIIIAIAVIIFRMVDASKKQKAEAARRALAQRRPSEPEEAQAPPSVPAPTIIPTIEDIFGGGFLDEETSPPPVTVVPDIPATSQAPFETIYEAAPFAEEAQSLEYIPEHPSKLQKTMPQLQSTDLPTLESLRTEEGDMNAPADNSAWEEIDMEEIRCFNLRAAVIHSAILNRPHAS